MELRQQKTRKEDEKEYGKDHDGSDNTRTRRIIRAKMLPQISFQTRELAFYCTNNILSITTISMTEKVRKRGK